MAGLIPQAFIDDLLSRSDIVDVIDKRVTLKKTGANYSALCPFHKEKSPSFSVQPERQFYYCFGCGAGGNAIGFIMNFDQVDFPEAVEKLARDNGMEVPREENKAAARKESEHARIFETLESANKFYQLQLRKNENREVAIDYLRKRGVTGVVARDFGIGYAPPGWDNLLAAIGTDRTAQANLLKAGMVIEKDTAKTAPKSDQATSAEAASPHYYDRFRHRIMFPIRDSRGRTIAFGGRVLGDDKPKYLNSPETPVFHKGAELYGLYECKKSGGKFSRMLLVEGYMDVIALAQMGIQNAVATLGTATSSTHLIRLYRMVPEIVFCFDGDQAGRNAAWRALEVLLPLMEDGRQARFLFLPEGEDPDTLVRKIGKDAFNQKLEQAAPLEKFFFDKLGQDLDVTSIEGKARLSKLARPLIARFPNGIYGKLMLDRLGEILGVSLESLENLLVQKPAEKAAPRDMPPQGMSQRPRAAGTKGKPSLVTYRKPASLKAIELLLRNPEIALHLNQDLTPLASAVDEGRRLLLALIQLVQKDPKTETFTLLGYCYGTSLGNQLTQLLKSETITPIEGVEREFNQILDNILSDILRTLEHLQLKDRLNSRFGALKD